MFPFLEKTRTRSDVRCKICLSEFTLFYKGITGIKRHMKSARHQKALRLQESGESSSIAETNDVKTENHIEMAVDAMTDEEHYKIIVQKQPVVLLERLPPSGIPKAIKSIVKTKLTERPLKKKSKKSTGKKKAIKTTKKVEDHKIWECYKCQFRSKRLKYLNVHMREHNEACPNECLCGMFFSAEQYSRHLCRGDVIQCEYCVETCTSTVSLLKHLEAHGTAVLMSKCPHQRCNGLFPMKALLKWHTSIHDSVAFKPHICDICNRGFAKRYNLKEHRTTHFDDKRNYSTLFASIHFAAVLNSFSSHINSIFV